MINIQTYQKRLVEAVKEAKELRGFKTYDKCCIAFNDRYHSDIEKGLVKPLNKDFLYRVLSKKKSEIKFSISNPRFVKLCEFLGVDMKETQISHKISEVAFMVDELVKEKPELEKEIFSVIKSIRNLSKGVKVS